MAAQLDQQIAMRVSVVTILVNLLLSGFKLAAGILAHSSAMISDAAHSASDVLSTVVVMVGIRISGKKQDTMHPYGHERFESVAAALLALILLGTGLVIGYQGILAIRQSQTTELLIPGKLALVAAIGSIVIKEWMYHYTRHAAKKIRSDALMADAWHHRSDAFSSVGSLIGILGARMGIPVLDPIASIVIALFILKAALMILRDALSKLIDHACDAETASAIHDAVLDVPDVLRLDLLRTRMFGAKLYVDVEIGADETLPLRQAHAIAQQVHDSIEAQFPTVKHCMVHVNPIAVAEAGSG